MSLFLIITRSSCGQAAAAAAGGGGGQAVVAGAGSGVVRMGQVQAPTSAGPLTCWRPRKEGGRSGSARGGPACLQRHARAGRNQLRSSYACRERRRPGEGVPDG